MFRLWGRIWKDNHMLKDTVICDAAKRPGRTRFFTVWSRSVMSWIWEIRSGWILRYGILRSTVKHVFIRIILLNRLTLITWKYR